MPEHYAIYLFLKEMIASLNISNISFNDIDEKIPNTGAFYFEGVNDGSKRRLEDGKPVQRQVLVTSLYQCEGSKEGILKGLSNMEYLRDSLEGLHNKIIYFRDLEISDNTDYEGYISFGQVDLITDIINHGKNEFEIPIYTLRFKVNYILRRLS